MEPVAGIVGYVLFILSEILPLINIQTNGFLQTLVLGAGKAFKTPENDNIELVVKPEQKKLIKDIEDNSQLKDILSNLSNDKHLSNTFFSIINNKDIQSVLSSLTTNNQLQQILKCLVQDGQFCNNIQLAMSSPGLIEEFIQNKFVIKNILNKKYIFDIIPLLNEDNVSIIEEIYTNPQLDFINKKLKTVENPLQKQQISNIVNVLSSKPDMVDKINALVNQA